LWERRDGAPQLPHGTLASKPAAVRVTTVVALSAGFLPMSHLPTAVLPIAPGSRAADAGDGHPIPICCSKHGINAASIRSGSGVKIS
jgi:hypothetical protein